MFRPRGVRWWLGAALGLGLALAAPAGLPAARAAAASAQPAAPGSSGSGASPAPAAGLDVVLCIDTSGSMAQNDPGGSRVAAARAIAARLGPQDRLGVVGFADAPTVLLPLQPMGTAAARAAVAHALGGIGAAGATDILGALQTGTGVLAADTDPLDWHVLVLLTDGVPDLPRLAAPGALQAYEAEMDSAAQALAQRGWVLDTVGLGSGVDGKELARLAQLGGGTYRFAPGAADLAASLLSLYSAARIQARTAPPPQPQPRPAPAPVQVTLQPLPPGAALQAGGRATLQIRAANSGAAPQVLSLSAAHLPAGWTAPRRLVVPAGSSVLDVPLRLGGRPSGPVSIALTAAAPSGVVVHGSALRWQVRVLSRPRGWLAHGAPLLAAAAAGFAALVLFLGYGGYLLRVLPHARPRGRLDIVAPGGERLATLRLPRGRAVTVGAATAPRGALRLPWVPGDDRLFTIRVDLNTSGSGAWRVGLAAWRRAPDAIVFAQAEWPYHLYPGPLPQQRVDLYDNTSFGAAGLTFTFRPTPGHADAEPVGADVLRSFGER